MKWECCPQDDSHNQSERWNRSAVLKQQLQPKWEWRAWEDVSQDQCLESNTCIQTNEFFDWTQKECNLIWNPFEKLEVQELWGEILDENEGKWGLRNPFGPDLVLTWSWMDGLMTWRETDCLLMGVIDCPHQDRSKIWPTLISWDGGWTLTKFVNAFMVTWANDDAWNPSQGSENLFEWQIGDQAWAHWWNCKTLS